MLTPQLSFKHFDIRYSALPVLCVLHTLSLAFQVEMPFGLLYGPLLYILCSQRSNVSYLHFLPFIAFSFVYLMLMFGSRFNLPWVKPLLMLYTQARLIIVALSLAGYGTVINILKNKEVETSYAVIKRLSASFIICAIGIFLSMMITMENKSDYIYYPQYFLSISTFIGLAYKPLSRSANNVAKFENQDIIKLKESLEARQLYLNPGINLDMLAKDAGIPKSELAQLINAYSGKTFYHLIAWYRIRYVADRLAGRDNSTIESLAYESGFNSKTSLNKYFREFTGLTPSEFRSGATIDQQLYKFN